MIIFSDNIDEPDEFVVLVKAYSNMVHGKITKYSDFMQYRIDHDELELIFQWDDCFGITVIVPQSTDLNRAYSTLKSLCKTL